MPTKNFSLLPFVALVFLGLSTTSQAETTTTTGTFSGNEFGYFFDSSDPPTGGNSFSLDLLPVLGLQRFNPAAGSLTGVAFTSDVEAFVDVFMDTNGILNPGVPHFAGFDPDHSIQIDIDYQPTAFPNTFRALASSGLNISTSCEGFPGEEDGCMGGGGDGVNGLDSFGNEIDRLELSDFIGEGPLDSISIGAFVPNSSGDFFSLNNIAAANADAFLSIDNGSVTIEYTYSTGASVEEPLLPIPPGFEGPEFDETDCVGVFCLVGGIGDTGPGVDSPLWFDPEIAIGYDYEILSGPNAAAITLPAGFGDDLYEVLIFDEVLGDYVTLGIVAASVELDLLAATGGLGASKFRVLGIEESAGVDPEDALAFPTGLTFVAGNTSVSMTMDPISVPEPATLGLLVLIGYFGCVTSRRNC